MRATRTKFSKRKNMKILVPHECVIRTWESSRATHPHSPYREEVIAFTSSRGEQLPTKISTSEVTPARLQASATESIFLSLPRSFSSSQAAALTITNLRWGLEHAREIRAVSLLKKEAEKLILPGWLPTNWEKLLA